MSIHKRAKDMGVSDLVDRIEKLEEENRNLKGEIERMKIDTRYDMEDINSLYKENEKLKEELAEQYDGANGLHDEIGYLKKENEKLREEIKDIEKNQEYRYHRCMIAERGGEDNS